MTPSSPSVRLKNLRQFLGYSQREIAEEFQVTASAVAHWESGFREPPGPILKLLEVYEESLDLFPMNRAFSAEALDASRDLFLKTLKTLEKEGFQMAEASRSQLKDLLNSFVNDIFSGHRLARKLKLKLIQRFLTSFEGSMGLSVKAAQLASFLESGLPSEVSIFLGHLQSSGVPVPFEKIREILEQELGAPLEKNFRRFNQAPLAVTSLAQIHLAERQDGEKVVVKIKHPRIETILKGQMKKLAFLGRLIDAFGKDIEPICEEIESLVQQELNYEQEVLNQEKFRNIFEGQPRIVIPRIHRDLCTKNIIVSQHEEGMNFETFKIRGSAKQKSEAAQLIAFFQTVSIFKFFIGQADTHPGNFLFRGDQVVFLDFGRVIELSEEEMQQEKRLYRNIHLGKKEEVCKHFRESGLIKNIGSFDFDGFWEVLQVQEEHHLKESFQITLDHVRKINSFMKKFEGRKDIHLNRRMFRALLINTSLMSIFGHLDATAHWRRQTFAILESGPDQIPHFQ